MPPNARVLQSILPPRAWLVTEGRGVAAALVKSHVSRVEGPHNLEITHQIAV